MFEVVKKSPLFQISLANKELFHSNFLKWLFDNYAVVAETLFFGEESNNKLKEVKREKESSKDLILLFTNGFREEKVVIENKFKSMPDKDQLDRYVMKKRNTKYVLLSLLPQNPNEDWTLLSYRELLSHLGKFVNRIEEINQYHGMMVRDYLEVTNELVNIPVSIDWDNEEYYYYGGHKKFKPYIEIRMHDFVGKAKFLQMKHRFTRSVNKLGLTFQIEKEWYKGTYGDLFINEGYTTDGLFDFKYFLGKALSIGVEVQGLKFCLFVEGREKENDIEKIAHALDNNGEWFDFNLYEDNNHIIYPTSGGWNTFNRKTGGSMKYRYIKIVDTKTEDVLNRMIDYLKYIIDNERRISICIDKVSHFNKDI